MALLLSGLTAASLASSPDGHAKFFVQGHEGYSLVVEAGRLHGHIVTRGVRSPVALERTELGWQGEVARYQVLSEAIPPRGDLRITLTPIVEDPPHPSPLPPHAAPLRFLFSMRARSDGTLRFRGWSGLKDDIRLDARVTLETGELNLESNDRVSSLTFELDREDSGEYRGKVVNLLLRYGTRLPYPETVRMETSGELDPAEVASREPNLFALLYLVFPSLLSGL